MEISWIGFFGLCLLASPSNELQCKDDDNKPVDWFVVYKIPMIKNSTDVKVREGTAYLYVTSQTVGGGWKLSKKRVSERDSTPGNTLSSLYNNSVAEKSIWILYNDRAAEAFSSNPRRGHTKGVLMADKDQAFWMLHSVPGYPPTPNTGVGRRGQRRPANGTGVGYDYPTTGRKFGQIFLCISMNPNQVAIITHQLRYNEIIEYRSNLPSDLTKSYPNIEKVAIGTRPNNTRPYRQVQFSSTGGVKFTSFAKTAKWTEDLYSGLIGPNLKTSLLAKTWLYGKGKLASFCSGKYKAENIISITLAKANVTFRHSLDHSKWAISKNGKSARRWVCIGDLNRASTQFVRSGGAICVNMEPLWSLFNNTIDNIEACP